MLWDQRGLDVIVAVPAEAPRVEDALLELHQPDAAKSQLPKRACGMQEVQVRGQLGCGDGARHRKTVFEQRPVKRFPVEGD